MQRSRRGPRFVPRLATATRLAIATLLTAGLAFAPAQASQPAQIQPAQIQPGQIQPGQIQPGQIQPGQIQPGQVIEPGQVSLPGRLAMLAAATAGPRIAAGIIRSAVNRALCLDNTQGRHQDRGRPGGLLLRRCAGSGARTWNQLWTAEADHTIRIAGQCLSGRAHRGAPAGLRPCAGRASQRWLLAGGQIRSAAPGYCLAARHISAGAAVVLSRCDATRAGQRWTVPGYTATSRALSAVGQLLDSYNLTGTSAGLFTSPADPAASSCPDAARRGNCWWWSAIALYALTDFAQQSPASVLAVTTIRAALAHTYHVICGMPTTCPGTPDSTGQEHVAWLRNVAGLRNFANRYFDDTGWWALTWLNAWQLTGATSYLYLAEELWNYLTATGWDRACGGALRQYAGPGAGGAPATQDVIVNAIYLRLSAWLSVTVRHRRWSRQYLNGIGGNGGARAVARWLAGSAADPGTGRRAPGSLISGPYANGTDPRAVTAPVASPGSRFMFADHLDGSCAPAGTQMWLSTQGMAVAALTDLAAADRLHGAAADAAYYLSLAGNLAATVLTDRPDPWRSPRGDLGSYYVPGHRRIGPPTVDAAGILAEPCDPAAGRRARWPGGCVLSVTATAGPVTKHKEAGFLPNKGIFLRSAYCLDHAQAAAGRPDPAIAPFIAASAASVWASDQDAETARPASAGLNQFGFLWGGPPRASGTAGNFATQAAALEALDASLGGSTAMC